MTCWCEVPAGVAGPVVAAADGVGDAVGEEPGDVPGDSGADAVTARSTSAPVDDVACVTPYPRADVPSSTPRNIAPVATLVPRPPMGHIFRESTGSTRETHRA